MDGLRESQSSLTTNNLISKSREVILFRDWSERSQKKKKGQELAIYLSLFKQWEFSFPLIIPDQILATWAAESRWSQGSNGAKVANILLSCRTRVRIPQEARPLPWFTPNSLVNALRLVRRFCSLGTLIYHFLNIFESFPGSFTVKDGFIVLLTNC